jgi:hypothetical protein
MSKTINEVATKVLFKLGRLPNGQVAPANMLNIVKDAYDGLYEDLFENSLVNWASDDAIPEFAVWPIIILLCARVGDDFGVNTDRFIALNDSMEGKLAELIASPAESDVTPGQFY